MLKNNFPTMFESAASAIFRQVLNLEKSKKRLFQLFKFWKLSEHPCWHRMYESQTKRTFWLPLSKSIKRIPSSNHILLKFYQVLASSTMIPSREFVCETNWVWFSKSLDPSHEEEKKGRNCRRQEKSRIYGKVVNCW